MNEEYIHCCKDELAWKEIDQLHEATLQISKQCFEYKKLCVGLLGVACGLVIKLTDNTLDFSIFPIGLLITVGFWIADATAYFFQKKVRSVLDQRMNYIMTNNDLQERRTITSASWRKAFFNSSMSLYYVLISLSLLGAACLTFGWIK